MNETVLLAIIGIAEMVLTSIVTFLLTRRKYRTEVRGNEIKNDGSQIDNKTKDLDFYIKLVNDNNVRLDELQVENIQLRRELSEMRSVLFNMLGLICTDMMCQNRKFDKEQCPYYTIVTNNFDDKK